MPKVITSPIERWQGTVTLCDPMTLPEAEAIDGVGLSLLKYGENQRITFAALDGAKIPAILACVKQWNLQDFPNPVTEENFPMSPKDDRRALIKWLWNEIQAIYVGASYVPNE